MSGWVVETIVNVRDSRNRWCTVVSKLLASYCPPGTNYFPLISCLRTLVGVGWNRERSCVPEAALAGAAKG